jgi:hypothetical protein
MAAKRPVFMNKTLCESVLAKIAEQVERTDHLIALIPEERMSWRPDIPGAFSAARTLGHLLECLSGFCAALCAAEPERLKHFDRLRDLAVNHACRPPEARERIKVYFERIQEGFALLEDASLGRKIPTVFVPEGETLLTLLLGNLEHLVNHKHQLFMYLQLMGLQVKSIDLYQFRGEGFTR